MIIIKTFYRTIKHYYRDFRVTYNFTLKQNKWRSLNAHNTTLLGFDTDISKISVGKHSYGFLNVYEFGIEGEQLIIGNYVSIAKNVTFILGGNHQMTTCTSYPLKAMLTNKDFHKDAVSKGPIIIEDECWIGFGVTIVSGVRIGKGSVIAAGSVVTKDIPSYSIAGGNPAKIIRSKHSQKCIDKLNLMSLALLPEEKIIQNIEMFYEPIETGIDKILKIT